MTGIDSTTKLPSFTVSTVLSNEPCDLVYVQRRVATRGDTGTVYTMVNDPVLKIFPDDVTLSPDEDDVVVVDGSPFKVLSKQHYFDGGSGAYRGSRLVLHHAEAPS